MRVGEIPSDAVLLATLLAPLPRSGAPRGPIPKGPPRPAARPAEAAAAPEDEELDRELSALEEEQEAEEEPAEAAEGEAAHAPLPEGALVEAAELHDERLGGVPTFSVGGDVQPWSLPQDVVAPEIVLAEMVRTAPGEVGVSPACSGPLTARPPSAARCRRASSRTPPRCRRGRSAR